MPVGRPTKYKPEYCEKADEYLREHQDEQYRLIKSDGDKSTSYENKLKVKLPTVEGFALYLGVNQDTLYEWAKHYPSFSEALRKIVTEQRKRLQDKGLSGDYNPVIAKLILSANHGMSEKSEIDHTSKGEKLGDPYEGISDEAKDEMRKIYEADKRKQLIENNQE